MRGSFSAVSIVWLAAIGCARGQLARPIPAEEMDQFKTAANLAAMQCREETSILGEAADRHRQLAEQAASNSEYERQAPREAAIAYRLYAAYLLLQPSGQSIRSRCKDALPWVKRTLETYEAIGDAEQLKASQRLLTDIADGKTAKVEPPDIFRHFLRVAMVEASDERVAEEVSSYLGALRKGMTERADGGSSPSEDADYLEAYGKGATTVGACIKAVQLSLMTKFPGKEVGSTRPYYINALPNGNTCVRYQFHGDRTVLYEWEVNKARGLVVPKTDAARTIMALVENVDQK